MQSRTIGDISDVILDKSGKAAAVIIGVGGFLGMGEHLVSVPFDQMRKRARIARARRGPLPPTRASNDNWYPDDATLTGATKDQLKHMPKFKY